MADGYGSNARPVSVDPFATIVEVGWPAGYYSDHGITFARTLASEPCSPSTGQYVGVGNTTYIDTVTFSPQGPNGPGSIHRIKGGGSLSGTFFGFPTGAANFNVGQWKALTPHTLSGGVNSGSVTIRASAPTVASLACMTILGPTVLNVATPGPVEEFRAFTADFGGTSFLHSATGQEYLFHRAQYMSADAVGISIRIFWRKAPTS